MSTVRLRPDLPAGHLPSATGARGHAVRRTLRLSPGCTRSITKLMTNIANRPVRARFSKVNPRSAGRGVPMQTQSNRPGRYHRGIVSVPANAAPGSRPAMPSASAYARPNPCHSTSRLPHWRDDNVCLRHPMRRCKQAQSLRNRQTRQRPYGTSPCRIRKLSSTSRMKSSASQRARSATSTTSIARPRFSP